MPEPVLAGGLPGIAALSPLGGSESGRIVPDHDGPARSAHGARCDGSADSEPAFRSNREADSENGRQE